jgi:spermidine/putrescine transport system ATP-binding protein
MPSESLNSPSPDFDLECEKVTRRFGSFTAVDNISFQIPKSSFFSILGPSGCGKTTLLRMLAGFLEPDHGDILIKGRSVLTTPPNKRPVNMVFQHLALFPTMNVNDNIAYGLKRRKTDKHKIPGLVQNVLSRIGLEEYGRHQVNQLSGGQRQRIAIARCLVLQPDVLLLDEPLGALDLKLREQMKLELKALQSDFGTTFIYITHDQSEALVMSDQVAVMNRGRFEQVGEPQTLYYQPQTPFVAEFVGANNRWHGVISGINGKDAKVTIATGKTLLGRIAGNKTLVVGDKVTVFLRPEAITISLPDNPVNLANRWTGKVEQLIFDGANSQVTLSFGDSTVQVALPQTGEYASLRRGDSLSIEWSESKCLVFGQEAGAGHAQ